MKLIKRRAGRALEHLRAILDAGQRGYGVAAANVENRALKILFQTYAKQRAGFKAELDEQIRLQGAYRRPLVSTLAAIHRGRINIFAALTIGDRNRELVVVREVLAGEQAALRAYQRALGSHLPTGIDETVSRQYEMVKGVVAEVSHMVGRGGVWLVARIYDSDADAARATKLLQDTQITSVSSAKAAAQDKPEAYSVKGHKSLFETILSSAVGGALWGAVSGSLAGFGVVHLPTLGLDHAPLAIQEMAWAETALSAMLAGTFVGALLGMFLGWGVHGGDTYPFSQSRRGGQVQLRVETDERHADEARQVLSQVNRDAGSQARRVTV